jgi:hypothetical protein
MDSAFVSYSPFFTLSSQVTAQKVKVNKKAISLKVNRINTHSPRLDRFTRAF